jgi:hypothetical protein
VVIVVKSVFDTFNFTKMTTIRNRKQLPKYCCHKPSGRAFVRIEGKMYCLGKYGSEASRREYDRMIGEFVANGRQGAYASDEILVENFIALFLAHMEKNLHYPRSTKNQTSRLLGIVNDLYGKQPVSEFGITALKTIRQRFVDQGLCRTTINIRRGTAVQQ